MNPPLTRQRCTIHPDREAAARCPACARFFCRECVTEHDSRLLCAQCLREELAAAHRPVRARGAWKKALRTMARATALTVSVGAAWFFFHLLGRNLAALPDEFHVDKVWTSSTESQSDDD